MKKSKVAISIDKSLLGLIDGKVDGSVIRSRSQAVEYFLRKGIQDFVINTGVILLKGEHQPIALNEIKGVTLIKHQLDLFSRHGIKKVFIVTHHTKDMTSFLNAIADAEISVDVIENEAKGNAAALSSIKGKLRDGFVAISGDTYNDFDLRQMIKKHINSEKLATMGLMSADRSSEYGTAVLDGDLIVDFQEKKKTASHVVNAGVYIFKPEVFELFDSAVSLEMDIFPKLARIKQLVGYFTHGEYKHIQ